MARLFKQMYLEDITDIEKQLTPGELMTAISLSHGRYFRQFWGTATFTSESLHTARCNSLYL